MSSLWTPGGEHPVDRGGRPEPAPRAEAPAYDDRDLDDRDLDGRDDDGPSPEEAEAIAREMQEVRAQIAAAPVADVIANHVMGLYELAAIHLSAEDPDFTSARTAIDAMGSLVVGLEGRLGAHEATLRGALTQLQQAFVELRSQGADPDGG